MLNPSALRCLRDMLDDPIETDILCDGGTIYWGHRPISRATLNLLLRALAIKDVGEGGRCERYVVKEDYAQAILRRPALADELEAAIYAGRSFFLRDGVIMDMPKP